MKTILFVLASLFLGTGLLFSQAEILEIKMTEATYWTKEDQLRIKFQMLNPAEYSIEGIPFVIPNAQLFSNNSVKHPRTYLGLDGYQYHYEIKKEGECITDDLEPVPDPYINAPDQQYPSREMKFSEQEIFRLRGTVHKTFGIFINPSEALCQGPNYTIEISYIPKVSPIDPEKKELIETHIQSIKEHIEEINTDLKSKEMGGYMMKSYCTSSIGDYLKSFELASELQLMKIKSEPFQISFKEK